MSDSPSCGGGNGRGCVLLCLPACLGGESDGRVLGLDGGGKEARRRPGFIGHCPLAPGGRIDSPGREPMISFAPCRAGRERRRAWGRGQQRAPGQAKEAATKARWLAWAGGRSDRARSRDDGRSGRISGLKAVKKAGDDVARNYLFFSVRSLESSFRSRCLLLLGLVRAARGWPGGVWVSGRPLRRSPAAWKWKRSRQRRSRRAPASQPA